MFRWVCRLLIPIVAAAFCTGQQSVPQTSSEAAPTTAQSPDIARLQPIEVKLLLREVVLKICGELDRQDCGDREFH